jgi:hypothetical protein
MTGFETNPRKVEYVVKARVAGESMLSGSMHYGDAEAVFNKLSDAGQLIAEIVVAFAEDQDTRPIAERYFGKPYCQIISASNKIIQRTITETITWIVKLPDKE